MTPTRHPHSGAAQLWESRGFQGRAPAVTLSPWPATQHSESTQLINVQDMVVVHRLFRRELIDLARLIRSVAPGDVERAAVIAGHARLVLAGLNLHHSGEDELLWPKLFERAAPSADLVERMQAQHAAIHQWLEQSTRLLTRWEARSAPSRRR